MKSYHELEYVQGAGEILQDEKFDWRTKKLKNQAVAPHIIECSELRKIAFESCGSRLEFAVDGQGLMKLIRAVLCHHPLCPICKPRRSMKTFHELKQICTTARTLSPGCRFAMLTLTVPNIPGEELPEVITHLLDSYKRLFRRAEVKKSIVGWFRSLEITKERERDGYFHPHFHVLLMVKSNYFKGRDYIKRDRWLELWREATRQPEITQVDIRVVKPNSKKESSGNLEQDAITAGAAEVGKYATKDSDYVVEDEDGDYRASEGDIETLCVALKHRRLIAYGGLLKQIRADLELSGSENDLVNIDPDAEKDDFVPIGLRIFQWFRTQKEYISK